MTQKPQSVPELVELIQGGIGNDNWANACNDAEAALQSLVEQLEAERSKVEVLQHIVDGYPNLKEQLEALQRNTIRRFQVIYNESDIDRMKLLAYDGIAEVTGNEWRDVRASNPASEPEGT